MEYCPNADLFEFMS